jgi:hypothetical protein
MSVLAARAGTSAPAALDLPVYRLHLMRAGCLLMGLGLATVALPKAMAGELDAATQSVLVSCPLIVVNVAVTPWRYVW